MSSLFSFFERPSAEAVVRQHAGQVHKHLKRIFGPAADVEDLFQSVFVEVIRSLPDFRGHARLSTWIRRITWNVAYQEMRQNYRRPEVVEFCDRQQENAGESSAEEKMAQNQELSSLYQALAEIDPKERMAVVLHDIEGFTLKEISSAMGHPLQTVASRLHAGRARLAENLRAFSPSVRDQVAQSGHEASVP